MKTRISIVNRSSGRFTLERLNGRDHLVTSMLTIEGDSVMNRILYPSEIVTKSAGQLDMLPAPDGHPVVNGKPVSAFNPLAINAKNFGGFTRNPRIVGKGVETDLVIDLDVANKSARGKKIVQRIKTGKRIGVSTGLIASVNSATGSVGGREFDGTVESISFDHVAVLLDAMPAGENTFTLNHDKPTKPTKRGFLMDELTLDLTPLAIEDRVTLSNMKAVELINHVKHAISVDEAKVIVEGAGFQVNQLKQSQIDEFKAHEAAFGVFMANEQKGHDELVEFIVANSKMNAEQLEGMSRDALDSLSASIAPKNTYINSGKSSTGEIELLDDVNMKVEA